MCQLFKNLKQSSAVVYKVVAVDSAGNYHSPAMGCKYFKNGRVPKVEVQHKLVSSFTDGILTKGIAPYYPNMVGRTAGFNSFMDAKDTYYRWKGLCAEGYRIAVIKAEVSNDLMEGVYNDGEPVVAGRRIKFLEEVADV